MTVKLSVEGELEALDAIESEILDLNDPDDEAPVSTALWEIEGTPRWTLDVYVFTPEQRDRAAAILSRAGSPEEAGVPDLNWVAEVQKQLAPIHVGEVFLYGSHDRDLPKRGRIALEIDAGQAFGTGGHATTQGCLLLLQALAEKAKPSRILDLGTGTGVLALVASRLWNIPVVATDIDPVAVETARENAEKNGFDRTAADFIHADGLDHEVFKGAPFDLIIANILAKPLIGLAPGIDGIASPTAHIILSGLLKTQEAEVFAAYAALGWRIAAAEPIGEWQALLLERNPGV